MKPTHLVAVLCLVASCGSTTPTPDPDPELTPVESAGARVELVSLALQGHIDDGLAATFRLVNGSPGPVEFQGYAPDSPAIELQSWRGGEWKRTRFAWCGTGLGWHSLAPGDEVNFVVQRAGPELPLRLAFTLRDGEQTRKVWSGRVQSGIPVPGRSGG